MGGIRYAPGKVKINPVVHVDDPKIRKKYAKIAEEAKLEADKRVEATIYEMNNLKTEMNQLEKKLSEVEADRLRLMNLKDPDRAVGADAKASAEAVVSKSAYDKQLAKIEGLQQSLELSRQLVMKLKSERPDTQTIQVEPIVQFVPEIKIKEVVRSNRKLIALIAVFCLILGGTVGYLSSRKSHLESAQVEIQAKPSPSASAFGGKKK